LAIAPVLWVACSGGRAGPEASPGSPAAGQAPAEARRAERPAAPAAVDAKCAGDLAPHREVLVRGRPTVISRDGVSATYRGRSEDLFDNGTTALVLSLEVGGEPWLPDSRDTAFHAFGEHCLRIGSSSDDRVELDVALQPAHEYDPHRCHNACCRDDKPAPDGTIECCFCSDKP
jgi:hypothetical protein